MKKMKRCGKMMVVAMFIWILCAILSIFLTETDAYAKMMGAWEYFPGGRICMGDGDECAMGMFEPKG